MSDLSKEEQIKYNWMAKQVGTNWLTWWVSLNGAKQLQREWDYENYNKYAKYQCNKFLDMFQKEGPFWDKIKTSLIRHDFILKPDSVNFVTCDQFFEGVFLPTKG